VLGDGLTYTPMHVNAVDAQLIEQLKLSAENVCMAFHVPPYMIGVGPMPTYNNIEALLSQYYAQALQVLIESIELLLDEGLELKKPLGTEFDLDDLLRMDTQTKVKSVADAIGAGFLAPNEGRAKFDLKPVRGGESPYLQQQNFSLEALAERDEDKPFSKPEPTEPEMPPAMPEPDDEEKALMAAFYLDKALSETDARAA
jgi:phage portal protein BeeE